MGGVRDPAKEYFKDGLWAWVSSAWEKVVADASGFLQINVAAQDIDVEVTQTAAADLTPGVCGWRGDSWYKLPMLWGYSGLAGQDLEDTNLSADTNYLIGATVDPGELLVVLHVSVVYVGTVPTEVRVFTSGTPGTPILLTKLTPTSGVWYSERCHAILAAGDHIRAEVYGATATDDFYFRYSGYTMKITE